MNSHEDWHGEGLVLIVDDEALVRRTARRMLGHLGFDVILAEAGKEAIELFDRHCGKLRCVVLDLMLPDVEGAKVFEELTRIGPEVPVIVWSGHSEHECRELCNGLPFAAYLNKPVDLHSLKTQLRAVLESGPP